ncbi:MAG: NAD(P)-dependent alcohol dehydrogenase [bacterium]|nr:NAD(P)-dependent alcohol dehydrogenase [bacterium]
MKAAIIEHYGSAEELRIRDDILKPSVRENEVLVKTIAAAMNSMDIETRQGMYKLFTPPGKKNRETLIGLEFAGEIESVGEGVTHFKRGDDVYGSMHVFKGAKAQAEYISVPARYVAHKPSNMTYEEASALPIGMIASIKALRNIGKLQNDQTVLINGASGGVGVYAVQLAKALGAEITTVSRQKSFTLVQSLGADRTVDYNKEDFTRLEEQFDIVFDVANTSNFRACKNILNRTGIYITTNPFKDLIGFVLSLFSSKRAGYLMAAEGSRIDLEYTNQLIEQGTVKPVVEKLFPFSRIVEAHKYFESTRRKGKVILSMRE